MKFNKGIIGIIIGFAVLAAGLAGLSVYSNVKSRKEFISDGYILDASVKENKEAISEISDQIYFASGAQYKEKFGKQVAFKNTSNEEVKIVPEQFIHYSDESLGSFVKGVIMDLNAIKEEQYGYYSVTKNNVLVKNGQSYEMTSHGEKIIMPEFIWKISDTDYTICSPSIEINLGSNYQVVLEGYAQIKYIDNGIVRIVHQQGTYQTVSSEAYLETADGVVLNLVGKNFYVEDTPVLSLDSIALNDSSYINVDENIDAPSIPTFNVVNGADGQNGMDGEIGLEGDMGAMGEDGFEGAQGAQGSQGAAGAAGSNGENGASGKAGNDGNDGVEGDVGDMGMDGKDGSDGKNAETSDDIKVNNNAQPEITMDTKEYKVTAGSANVKLSMTDLDGSLVLPEGSDYPFTLKMFNKQTMEEIEIPNQEALQSSLMNGTPVSFNVAGLNADTEYLIQVVGSYEVEDGQIREVVFYNKSFRTEAIGLSLYKKSVSDHDFVLGVDKNNSDLETYILNVYKNHTSSGEPDIPQDNPMVYTWKRSEGAASSEYLFENAIPLGTEVDSNTQYYACITGVTDVGGAIKLDYSVTEIAFKTLKEKPYQSVTMEDGSTQIFQIPTIAPELYANDKNGSMELVAPDLVDKDNGIIGYRYELHRITTTGDYEVEAAYTYESKIPEVASFPLPTGDTSEYVGKVIAIFDDNEKTVEYSTAYSAPKTLSNIKFPTLNWTFTQLHHEAIKGMVTIVDNGDICRITADNPAYLIIRGEYDNERVIEINPNNCSDTIVEGEHRISYAINVDGLRTDKLYNFSVLAPVNLDGDRDAQGNNIISETERTTYLGGTVKETTDNINTKLAIVGEKAQTSVNTFDANIRFTSAKGTGANKAEQEYEAGVLHQVTLELYHVTGEGENQKWNLMKDRTFYDEAPYDQENHKSIFGDAENGYWVDESKTRLVNGKGLALTSQYDGGNYLAINPETFDLENNYEEFFTGGQFVIRVKGEDGVLNGYDYTIENHNNKVYFESGQSEYWFTIQEQHVAALNPNDQVSVSVLTKSLVNPAGYPGLNSSTPVGLQIQSKYGYPDAHNITYYIYEVDPDVIKTIDNMSEELLYPELIRDTEGNVTGNGYDPAESTVYPNQINRYASTEDGKKVGKLVAYATLNDVDDEAGNNIERVRLLFDGNKFVNQGKHGTAPETWTTVEDGYVFERGKQYFVTYTVNANYKHIDCDTEGPGLDKNDVYPYCTEKNRLSNVPYYRSPIVTVNRQVPKVERYFSTNIIESNKGNIMEWKYRINDPDCALTNGDKNGAFDIKWTRSTYDLSSPSLDLNSLALKADTEYIDALTLKDYTDHGFVPYRVGSKKSENAVRNFSLYNNYYYVSEYSYTLNNVAPPTKVTSTPFLYITRMTDLTSDITKLEDTQTKETDRDKNVNVVLNGAPIINSDKTAVIDHEETIVNEGGYRYKIALRGGYDTLKRISALRVTVSGSHPDYAGTKPQYTVVYDPVFINLTAASEKVPFELNSTAYAYLDTGALAEMVNGGVQTADIKVEAYYASGRMGVDASPNGFVTTTIVSEENEDGETVYKDKINIPGESTYNTFYGDVVTGDASKRTNLFAIKQLDNLGNSSYNSLVNGSFSPFATTTVDAKISRVKSIFAPGSLDSGGVGFDENSYVFSGRYSGVPLVNNPLSNKLDSYNQRVTFDESGMRSGGLYYVPENLSFTELNFVNPGDATLNLSAILPAVTLMNKYDPKIEGAKSVTPIFEALGTGANQQTELYIKIYECIDKTDNHNEWAELNYVVDRTEEDKTVFNVPVEANQRYRDASAGAHTYNEDHGAGTTSKNAIKLDYKVDESGNARYLFPTSIRGLNLNTDYKVVVYTYARKLDGTMEYKELYCDDKGTPGYEYPFHTLGQVDSLIGEKAKFTYDSYSKTDVGNGGTGKKVELEFNIDGDDGVGIDVFYELCRPDGTPITGVKHLGYASPLIEYYSQDPAKNPKITFSFEPDTGEVKAGNTYLVKAYISEKTDVLDKNNILGTAERTFTAYNLARPTFTISRSINKNQSGTYDANVTIVSGNPQHSVIGDKYKVYICPAGKDVADEYFIEDFIMPSNTTRPDGIEPHKLLDPNGKLKNLPEGSEYKIILVAEIDLNNDGEADEIVKEQAGLMIEKQTDCFLSTTATANNLLIEFGRLSNFKNVDHIAFKVSNANNGTPIREGTVDVKDLGGWTADGTYTSLTLSLDGTFKGAIEINVQYYDADDNYMGSNGLGITVGAANTALAGLFNMPAVATTQSAMEEDLPAEETTAPSLTQAELQGINPSAGAGKVVNETGVADFDAGIGAQGVLDKEIVVGTKPAQTTAPSESEETNKDTAGETKEQADKSQTAIESEAGTKKEESSENKPANGEEQSGEASSAEEKSGENPGEQTTSVAEEKPQTEETAEQ